LGINRIGGSVRRAPNRAKGWKWRVKALFCPGKSRQIGTMDAGGLTMETKTCARINLNNLVRNLEAIRRRVAPAGIIPVVKADAYGHGAVAVSRRLVRAGLKLFAVARFEEAMQLRDSGIGAPILIFGRVFPDDLEQAIAADFRLTLFDPADIDWIAKTRRKKPAMVHVKVDTGMGRVGVLPDRQADFFNALEGADGLRWEGLYSHFATADEQDKRYARLQLDRFRQLLARIGKMKIRPAMIHMANSGAVLDLPESYFDAVRPGILLYGHYPSRETSGSIAARPVMTLQTAVAHIRRLPADCPVSYGRRWVTPGRTQIAVLPLGYADGIRRELTNRGEVLIKRKRYPMVGTVTMDTIMVNVGEDPIAVGDEAIIWGESDQGSLPLLEIAAGIGTIPYELTCGVSARVKRVYVDD